MHLIFFAILSNTVLFSSLLYLKGQNTQSSVAFVLGFIASFMTFYYTRSKISPLVHIKYDIAGGALTIKDKDKSTIISYDDISNIQFSFLSKLFGWFTMNMKDGKKYYFSFLIERSDYILEAVANHNNSLIPQDKFLNYRNVLLHSDHSLARLYGGSLKATLFKYLGYPSIFAVFYWFSGGGAGALSINYLIFQCIKMFLITFFINLMIGKVVFLASEAFVQRKNELRMRANPNLRARDMEFEGKMRQVAYAAHFLLFLGFCIFLMFSIH